VNTDNILYGYVKYSVLYKGHGLQSIISVGDGVKHRRRSIILITCRTGEEYGREQRKLTAGRFMEQIILSECYS
jgi:hypothetical protein